MLISDNYLKLYTNNKQALQIIYVIKKYTEKGSKDLKDCTIVDANAGVGGNSVFFCKYCKFVYCIDTELEAITYLEHNLKEFENKTIINENCLDVLKIITYDIIFFDPPWGGPNYKFRKNVQLYLSGINVNKIIESLYFSCNMIILKKFINFLINYNYLWKIHINIISWMERI